MRAFFDIGPFTRTYGITMHDGGTPQAFWTADSAVTDSDPENDGAISWKQTAILSYQGPGSEAGQTRGFFRAIQTAP